MKKLALGGLLFILVAGLALGHYEWRETYRCNLCFSRMTVSEWRLGVQPLGYPVFGADRTFTFGSIRLTTPVEHVLPSSATRLFPQEHRHEWVFAQASPFYLFGKKWAGCVLGESRQMSPFAYAFLNNSDFRAHAEHLIRSNQLSQIQAQNLFVFDPGRQGKHDPRYTRGVQLVRDFIATHPNRMFEESFRTVVASPGGAAQQAVPADCVPSAATLASRSARGTQPLNRRAVRRQGTQVSLKVSAD